MTMKQKQPKTEPAVDLERIGVDVPKSIKRAFQLLCVGSGYTMTEVILWAIGEIVAGHIKPPVKK